LQGSCYDTISQACLQFPEGVGYSTHFEQVYGSADR
jgi:hypothetical protein